MQQKIAELEKVKQELQIQLLDAEKLLNNQAQCFSQIQEEMNKLIRQVEKDKTEWNDIILEFQNQNFNQEDVQMKIHLLRHLSHYRNFQKEINEIQYEFQSAFDNIFQNKDFEIF
jgi:hypothetical protein